MKARWLVAMEKKPWALAVVASFGTTLLVASAFALLAPPDLLDAAVALGDRRLALAVAGLFATSASTFRIAFRRRPSAEEDVDADPARGAVAATSRRRGEDAVAPGLRSYLR